MVKVQNLTKRYGDIVAIDGVSFEVKKGQILGFLGPNGAGKTTTMRIISGYMPAGSGTVEVAGYDVFKHSIEVRKRIGYLPEHPPLYLDMSVTAYLNFVAKLKRVPRKDRQEAIKTAIERCGLKDVEHRIIGNLSKGFRQRVGLAQAIIHNPEVLILDEPTIGLDPLQIREIRELIRSLAGAHTVVLSTHILAEATMICDHVVIINRGKVAADDSLENLARSTGGNRRILIKLAEPNDKVIPKLSATPGVAKVEKGNDRFTFYLTTAENAVDPAQNISLSILQGGWGLIELSHETPSLEEIFVRLTSE